MSIIKELIEKLLNIFRSKAKEIDPEIRGILNVILPITREIKEWLENPIVAGVIAWTPTKWDDVLRFYTLDSINWVLREFGHETIEEFVSTTATLDKPTQNARLIKLNSKFVEKISEVPEHIADSSAQIVFSGLHK